MTFSYTMAFWSWEDWEDEIDWMALHGINIALAWVGQEKHLVDLWREVGFNDSEISQFFSGPAFQAWNRFGNIQADWSGSLPTTWINQQFEMQKQIVARMVELGVTPILPAFTGFVPRAVKRVFPNATVLIGSQWNGFSSNYTNDTFLNPSDNVELFTKLQTSFMQRQLEAYGNVTHIFTLDQYNENTPSSGNLTFLRNLTFNTWKSLKAGDPSSIWLMQGWLFRSEPDFWTDDRVEAYLGGVENNTDMLILDLYSESDPQWQRTNSYYGKPWIWCQLHDYGGNLGLYGQLMNITYNPIEALANSSSLVGFGLTMEGQEGNQIIYDLLLDQAWSADPIETDSYFHDWVSNRYNSGISSGNGTLPNQIYSAWDQLRTTVYNNTNSSIISVQKSILELQPSITGLYNKPGDHGTLLSYQPSVLVSAWNQLMEAAEQRPWLWDNPSFQYDMVDITRQALSNAFSNYYLAFVLQYNLTAASQNTTSNSNSSSSSTIMLNILESLDMVLNTNKHFRLSTWIEAAKTFTTVNGTSTSQDYYEYNARNQITLWGPNGEITDYASKVWGGLVSSYYIPRWKIFFQYLTDHPSHQYNATELKASMLNFSKPWQVETWGDSPDQTFSEQGELKTILDQVRTNWTSIFGNA